MSRCGTFLVLLASLVAVASALVCNSTAISSLDPNKRYVSRDDQVLNITLLWASDPARAASAWCAVIMRRALHYERVYLRQTPYFNLHTLASDGVKHMNTREYNELLLALSSAWEPGNNPKWEPNKGQAAGLAGPRLGELGSSSVPVLHKLHVQLAKRFRNQTECHNFTQWSFYTNVTTLKKCGFTDWSSSDNPKKNAVVYEMGLENATMIELLKFADFLNFQIKDTDRQNLFKMIDNGNFSFLFIDYDMWSDHEYVRAIPQPFCLLSEDYKCFLEPSNLVAMRAGDVSILHEYAPTLLQFIHNFTISPKTIRDILQYESEGIDIETAANKILNRSVIRSFEDMFSNKLYEIAIFYCKDDPNFAQYDDFVNKLSYEIDDMYSVKVQLRVRRYDVPCSDENYVKFKINEYLTRSIKNRLIGALVGGVKKVEHVAKTVDGFNVPVLFYDAMGIDTNSSRSVWLTTGRTRHIALALRHFMVIKTWARLAILSEPTETAKRLVADLKTVDDIAIRDYLLPHNFSNSHVVNLLRKIKKDNAHIILVNTNYRDASTILAEAARLGMNSIKNYAWFVREWRPNNRTTDIRHFTFSFWCRCGKDASKSEGFPGLRKQIDALYPDCTWPPHIATIANALYVLRRGFNSALLKCPQLRDNLRNEEAIRLFRSSLIDEPTQGLIQNLTFKGHTLEETVVFVDEWHGHLYNHLARWRVNAQVPTGKVFVEHQRRIAYLQSDAQPDDGSTMCLVSSGDPYLPTCHDWEWVTAMIFIMLTPPTLMFVYRFLRRRLEEHERKIICQVLARRQQRTAALSTAYLIDRSAISMCGELGSGRFGYVRGAWLRIPGKSPQFVAAKAIRENQDEGEILHEACVLAPLQHENIIRLIGVCIDKDPPLVIMEIAFFGDLLQYLRDRRYLVEVVDTELIYADKVDEETSHVSAEALTRMAREAASALAYLALQGVIHRDLRASNCLVDAKRSLKLADFGLARDIRVSSSDGKTEYACRRPGVFPVLWMAPESLLHGVFSPATDVWALGVLVFELVTLGARPYGDLSPHQVMEYVASGGEPTLPRDASSDAITLARMCWQREAEQRPTAAYVVAYLTDRSTALRPALDGDTDKPFDHDSGCGESPMSDLLPC